MHLVNVHLRFGDRKLIERFNSLENPNSSDKLLSRMLENVDKGVTGFDALKDVVDPSSSYRNEEKELKKQLKDNILRYVSKGILVGYGFSSPRNVEDVPQLVPNDLWAEYWHSTGNTLTSGSLTMENIRVARKELINDQLSLAKGDHEEIRPAGRPSRKNQIIDAFHILADEGEIDFSKPKTHCYALIRNRVLTQYPEENDGEKGLGDKAIQKHISPLFDTKKNEAL